MKPFLSEAQHAALEHLAAAGGSAPIGPRPLTLATAVALQRQGLVRVNVPAPGQASLTPDARRRWMPMPTAENASAREEALARSVLVIAQLGGMPDTYWPTDTRIALACSTLGLSPTAARRWAEAHPDWSPDVEA